MLTIPHNYLGVAASPMTRYNVGDKGMFCQLKLLYCEVIERDTKIFVMCNGAVCVENSECIITLHVTQYLQGLPTSC